MKQQLKADASGAGDFSADRSTASKMISIANPMNAGSTMMGKVTGSNKYKAHDGAPLYFPSAKSAALRSHSGVKSVIPPARARWWWCRPQPRPWWGGSCGAAVGVAAFALGRPPAALTRPLSACACFRSALHLPSRRFKVYRIDSPDDISDPIIIVFKLDLSSKRLRTNNPAAVSQKVSAACR